MESLFSNLITPDVIDDAPAEGDVQQATETQSTGATETAPESSGNDGTSITPIAKEGEKVEQKTETKQPEAKDTKPDIKAVNEVIAKAGLTYVSNGKTYKVDNIESLLKVASRAKPIEDSLSELQQQRQQLAPVAELIQQLRGEDDELSEQALEQLVSEERLNKLAEARLRRMYEEEQRGGPLTEREKQLQKQIQAQQMEIKKVEQQKLKEQEMIRQQEEQRQIMAVKEHMAKNVTDALELMDLPPKLEPLAVEFMKPIIRNLLNNGVALSPDILAEKVAPIFEQMLMYKTKNLEGEKLIKFLGNDVGKRFRSALLAQMQPKPTQQNKTGTSPAPSKQDDANLADFFKKTVF